jgi:4-hydroxythreonine-4-phosphate dehydrogenase
MECEPLRASPTILVTQGEPAGIGPEVALRALARFSPPPGTRVRLAGEPEALAALAARLGLSLPEDVLPVRGVHPALAALEEAARLAAAGLIDAVVTAPVNKARLRAAGFPFPGQTEFFAERLRAKEHAMMLADGNLRVVPLTTHCALREVPGAVTAEAVFARATTLHTALRQDFGIPAPRIAVLGLNPHAGEAGHFGDEELLAIAPAVARLTEAGMDVEGPLPADAAFGRGRDRYDAILGMYHDQVLAPFKALSAGRGVNVTLGLPVIRTSPDHGTAEDIAGRGIADPSSMLCALELAVVLAARRGEFLGLNGGAA